MFASRRRDPTPHLAWRVRLFIGAAILALVGMFTNLQLPIWGAIGLLAVAFVLRFVGEETVDTDEELDDEELDAEELDDVVAEERGHDADTGETEADEADPDI